MSECTCHLEPCFGACNAFSDEPPYLPTGEWCVHDAENVDVARCPNEEFARLVAEALNRMACATDESHACVVHELEKPTRIAALVRYDGELNDHGPGGVVKLNFEYQTNDLGRDRLDLIDAGEAGTIITIVAVESTRRWFRISNPRRAER